MKIVFLSHEICEKTPLYAGKKGILIKQDKAISKGNHSNSLLLQFTNHCSTHIDVPYHFLRDGKKLTDFKANEFIFNSIALVVFNCSRCKLISYSDIKDLLPRINKCELLLIKTGFEKMRNKVNYWKFSPGLAPDLVFNLKRIYPNLKAVGMDFISVSSLKFREEGRLAHKNLLSNRILLLEDMKLSLIKKAPNMVVAAPLLIKNADAAPVTVMGIYK